jgi:hypothetical protein
MPKCHVRKRLNSDKHDDKVSWEFIDSKNDKSERRARKARKRKKAGWVTKREKWGS